MFTFTLLLLLLLALLTSLTARLALLLLHLLQARTPNLPMPRQKQAPSKPLSRVYLPVRDLRHPWFELPCFSYLCRDEKSLELLVE